MRIRRPTLGVAAVLGAAALTVGLALPAAADNPVNAPFVASNVNTTTSWCPNFHADNGGCSADNQTQTFEVVPYHHANVTTSGANGYINLTLDSVHGAAVNTQTQESWAVGTTIGETLNIDCTNSGVPRGWPAFWTDSAAGASGGGEMDIYEGLDQTAKWGIHVGSIALPTSGNAYPNPCGVHNYKVVWDTTKAAFYEDGVWQGKVTATDVQNAGGSWITASQRIINDYGYCTASWCNPTNNFFPSVDQIQQQWTTP